MRFSDYVLMRTPIPRMGEKSAPKAISAQPGQIVGSRLVFAFGGLLLGIFFSFFVTDLITEKGNPAISALSTQQQGVQNPPGSSPETIPRASIKNISLSELPAIAILSFIICLLTYPAFYQSLKLYQNEPAFLVLFIAFQYGFFWQSVIKTIKLL